jgi:phage-related protein
MPWILPSVENGTTRPKFLKASGCRFLEIVENDQGSTYRAAYTVKFKEAVFVLHVFQKKSKSGIATPRLDMEIIRERLRAAERLSQEMWDEETHD